jgi:tetratricopeptide (TPR) repeat protein
MSHLYEAGKMDDAIRVAGTALSNARHEGSPQGLVTALENLASLEQEAGNIERSESLYVEALETAEASGAPEEQLSRVRVALAGIYDFSQREEMAIPLYEKVIASYESANPPREEDAAQLRNNLAMIYKGLGKHALAEQHYLVALETLEKIHGRDHERVAAVFNNMGGLYDAAGHPAQAKEMHEEALEIRLNVFGPDHPEVAQSYCNMATACYAQEDYEKMQEYYDKGLEILERHLETDSDSYEEIGGDYAAVLESIGETRKAAIFRRRMAKALRRA